MSRRHRVLIVEDYADTRKMYAKYLAFRGFDVSEARDGIEALQKVAASRPDVIVMDLSLPRLDGWEATRRLKAARASQRIPVIALTGHALAGHEQGARDAGCDAFLSKPCLPDALAAQIDLVLRAEAPARPARRGATRNGAGPRKVRRAAPRRTAKQR